MFYEEKTIDGVTYYRTDTKEHWQAKPAKSARDTLLEALLEITPAIAKHGWSPELLETLTAYRSAVSPDNMRRLLAEHDQAIAKLQAPVGVTAVEATQANTWAGRGEEDPHGKGYDCERAQLTLGNLTDDELANGAFMNYDQGLDLNGILAGTKHSPIAWMTGVKDRIRWLSRSLNKALKDAAVDPALQVKLANLHLYEEIAEHYARCAISPEALREWVAEAVLHGKPTNQLGDNND